VGAASRDDWPLEEELFSMAEEEGSFEDMERRVRDGLRSSLDANPRATIAYIAALAQGLGECLALVGASPEDMDELTASWEEMFAGAAPAVHAFVKTYLFVGQQMTAGTERAVIPISRAPRPQRSARQRGRKGRVL
jgi:hypothetical protein